MKPVNFVGANCIFGQPKDWDASKGECAGLPVLRSENGFLISVWEPTWRERLRILFGRADVILHVRGPGHPVVGFAIMRASRE